jgi:hypothetical protein
MLLKRAMLGQENETSSLQEEMYMRLFSKIGRDFVYREDFVFILTQILLLINPNGGFPIDLQTKTEAVKKALVYKNYINSGIVSEKSRDLINLDED